ncbi:colicin D [Methylocaldum marinum]|jgi:hypothetical protein|uniref:Colicin D n=1 Tax=Methylocaldum marinum TaxID=1432792 RepID=A0A250KTG1_9GAMM|nr:colicin immunity domain-containing protein [Methylocaldum marinum]BBA34940.1 colicin D [Methylocaldum marinum]
MSVTILEFARSFVDERLSADEFANCYLELWKIERDNNLLQQDDDKLSECLSSIFCLADQYNPDHDRDEHELDAVQLREEVAKLISGFGF